MLAKGDIVYIKSQSTLRCWEPGTNYVTSVEIKKNGDFWITCFNPSMEMKRYNGFQKAYHYQFWVYKKQFDRSVQSGSILIFKKKSI